MTAIAGEASASVVVDVTDPSAVGAARRSAVALARSAGFDEDDRGRIALVVTEVGNNLVAHAQRGELLLRVYAFAIQPVFELLAIDRGPGMSNLADCLRDGFSTAGTSGEGLGAVRRIADGFDVHSTPGRGTVLSARIAPRRMGVAPRAALDAGGVCVPLAGEELCGDAFAFAELDDGLVVTVVDGLGHGADAAVAARAATRVFEACKARPPNEILLEAHAALLRTRGAAMAVAALSWREGRLRFAGVGNVSATVFVDERRTGLPSRNGIVGHGAIDTRLLEHPFGKGALLVMHSDGVSARFDLDELAGARGRHPSTIAGILYRDHRRTRDDACVVVVRSRLA